MKTAQNRAEHDGFGHGRRKRQNHRRKTNRGTLHPTIVVNCAGVYTDVIADMAGDRTFTIHPRKGTDIILDKKVGKYINTTEVKSPITVLSDEKLSLKNASI